jgi:hypothetical protein
LFWPKTTSWLRTENQEIDQILVLEEEELGFDNNKFPGEASRDRKYEEFYSKTGIGRTSCHLSIA